MTEIVEKHVLPKYSVRPMPCIGEPEYAADIERILAAYEGVPNEQRLPFLNYLRGVTFVRSIDPGIRKIFWDQPRNVYLPTEQLKELFDGVRGVRLLDDTYDCLRGKAVRDLMEACGAASRLIRVSTVSTYSGSELKEIRRQNGLERQTRDSDIQGRTLRGVPELLEFLHSLSLESRQRRSTLLWSALSDVAKDSIYGEFRIPYEWGYLGESRSVQLNTEIVRQLNKTAWVPDQQGELHVPILVDFTTLRDAYGWEEDPILTTIIKFKPSAIATLARETGIATEALDLMQKHGLTADDLQELISSRVDSQDALLAPSEDSHQGSTLPDHTANGTKPRLNDNSLGTTSGFKANTNENGSANGNDDSRGSGTGPSRSTQRGGGQQTFRSYIAVHTDQDADPDGLEHSERLTLEKKSRQFVLKLEPEWQEALQDNPGFDLYQEDSDGNRIRFCEVKAMSVTMENRPATMTRTQFEKAQEEREAYWLYVLENADTDSPHLVKIQDPAGKGQTFTFDKGWLAFAASEASEASAA